MKLSKKMKTAVLAGLMSLSTLALAAGGAGKLEPSGANINDMAALQNGAKLFVNYCMSCHSADFMRYNRLAEDLGLSEEDVMENLMFADGKIGDTMSISMDPKDAELWFGKTPPDLSLIGRSRGADWLYAYMRSFYKDESGRWNNTIMPNVSMPHVMWPLQGVQTAVFHDDENGNPVFEHFELEEAGTLTAEEYDDTVRDLVTFLDYLSEPAKLKRKNIGIWVLLFLAVFTLLAYILKAEYWRDVH